MVQLSVCLYKHLYTTYTSHKGVTYPLKHYEVLSYIKKATYVISEFRLKKNLINVSCHDCKSNVVLSRLENI